MRYNMSLFISILIAAMITSVVMESVATSSEIEGSPQKPSGILSRMLSKQTIPLLEEVIVVSYWVSSFIGDPIIGRFPFSLKTGYVDPNNPAPGIPIGEAGKGGVTVHKTDLKHQKELVRSGEANVTISETSLKAGVYSGWIFSDTIVMVDKTGKILAVSLQADTTESCYIATGARIAGNLTYGLKESAQPSEGSVTVPETTLEPGTYSAFNGADSAVILDKTGDSIAVLIGEKNNSNLYIATDAKVTGNLTQAPREGKLPEGAKVTFSEATLQEGTYEAFNGSDSAFIFNDKGEISAILIKQNGECELYIVTEAKCDAYIWKEGTPEAILQPGTYKALISQDSAVILDEAWKSIYNVSVASEEKPEKPKNERFVLKGITPQHPGPASRVMVMKSSDETYPYVVRDAGLAACRFNGIGRTSYGANRDDAIGIMKELHFLGSLGHIPACIY